MIRKYQSTDCKKLAELFYHTVHTINAKDYTQEQLNAWAPGKTNLYEWDKSLSEHNTIVAAENEIIVGFGDIHENGYLDRLFVHHEYQRRGIATAICDELEKTAHNKIFTHASVTAKMFFEKRGYKLIRKQQIERQGVQLTNFFMEKEL